MKTILTCLTVILAIGLLFAETNPTNDYFNNPTTQSFSAAWNYSSEQLTKDPSDVNTKILMAYLANAEANRLAEEIAPAFNEMEMGSKFQFANLLLTQNRFDEAIEIYDELNEASPGWSCPWRHKGEALYSLKRYKEAEVSLGKAIETNLEHYDAYIWMAKTQYQLKKYKAALKNLETALTLSPGAEESPDEAISENSIKDLHETLLIKTHKKK